MHPVLLDKDIDHLGTPEASANTFTFEGRGVSVYGNVETADRDYRAQLEVTVDGKTMRTMDLPARHHDRTADCLYWNYQLPNGRHTVSFRLINPQDGVSIKARKIIYYP